jgi:uncharacterized membrane protein
MTEPDTTNDDAEVARHVRRLRVRALRERSRESLLFLPVIMLLVTLVASFVLARVDARLVHRRPSSLLTFAPDTATSLLATIAGATITTAGVVFSLLVVSLQLASGQFSPRVLRGFWRDRFGQILIGLLLSTFAFCVLTLAQVDPKATHAPTLGVAVALALALASVVFIVVYLDRISRQQYVGRILDRVVGETLRLVRELPYGPTIGMRVGPAARKPDLDVLGEGYVVPASRNGWVQQISRRAVTEAAPAGSVVRLETRVGAYVVRGQPLVTVWPRPSEAERVGRRIASATVVGSARTMQQDIDFGFQRVQDIALKALSPAINDPTTAIEVVMRLASVMRPLLAADLPDQCVRDEEDRILLTPWDLDHAEYVAHAFGQLRTYGAGHPAVVLALVRTLRMLHAVCADRAHARAEVERQLELTLAGARNAGLLPEDLERVTTAAVA